jgi:hypothetical protein
LIGEVEARLLVTHERRVEHLAPVSVSVVATANSVRERCVAHACPAERRRHGAVQPSAALLQVAAVPVSRQRDGEADAAWLAVRAGAPVERCVVDGRAGSDAVRGGA